MYSFFWFIVIFGMFYVCCYTMSTAKMENYPLGTLTERPTESRNDRDLENHDKTAIRSRQGKGMSDNHDYDHDHHHDIIVDHPPEMPKVKEESKQAADVFTNYYDFIINEGSFKFWSAFQLFTALLLIYSSLAAAYYAKFNIITTDYDYYDDFFGRSNDAPSTSFWSGLSSSTIQRIYDAISSKKYT